MKHRILKNGAVEIGENVFYWPTAQNVDEIISEIQTKTGQYYLLLRFLKVVASRPFCPMVYSMRRGRKFSDGMRLLKKNVAFSFETPKRLLRARLRYKSFGDSPTDKKICHTEKK